MKKATKEVAQARLAYVTIYRPMRLNGKPPLPSAPSAYARTGLVTGLVTCKEREPPEGGFASVAQLDP